MSVRAQINGDILSWAINRSQLPVDALAHKMGKTQEVIEQWENENSQPTFNQAKKLADQLRIPFGYFFLPSPPIEELEIPDLRTIGDNMVRTPSPDLRDIVKQVLLKQQWFKEYLVDQGEPELKFVGSLNVKSNIKEAAKLVRSLIKVNPPSNGNYQQYFSTLVDAIEGIGILVMRAGIVGNNTRRKLSVEEFRGFAISDKIVPIIFINSSDAPSARLFTLIHEFAHILIGSSGISGVSTREERQEELFCNQVAAEFLAPQEIFLNRWDKNITIDENISSLSIYLHISVIATARKALTEKLISEEQYWRIHNDEKNKYIKQNADSSGGDFYANAIVKNSKAFAKAVCHEALRGTLLLRDAGHLLNIPPNKVKEFARNLS